MLLVAHVIHPAGERHLGEIQQAVRQVTRKPTNSGEPMDRDVTACGATLRAEKEGDEPVARLRVKQPLRGDAAAKTRVSVGRAIRRGSVQANSKGSSVCWCGCAEMRVPFPSFPFAG